MRRPVSAGEPVRDAGGATLHDVDDVRVVPRAWWDRLLSRMGVMDTYTCAGYVAASALLEVPGTRPVLLHVGEPGGEVALPLLLRPLPDGRGWDAVTPYGYGGPVALGEPDVVAFGAALDAWAVANGVVATFLRLHPLLGNDRLVPPTAELVLVGRTIAWDVSPGRDLVAGMHADNRRSVRRADEAGVQVTVVERPATLEPFRELYEATMRRLGAQPFYYFPDAYWDALTADDPWLQPVVAEARLGDRLVAAVLCLAAHPWLHAHLSCTDDAARDIGASARAFLAAAQWAQQQGMSRLHLGGGVGGDATSRLYGFKRRFDRASEPLAFQTAKLVHDRDRYRQLAGTDSTEGYFPPWRTPS